MTNIPILRGWLRRLLLRVGFDPTRPRLIFAGYVTYVDLASGRVDVEDIVRWVRR